MENKKKMSKKSKIFITIGLVLVALIICTIIELPNIKLKYIEQVCNKEYEQKCDKLIKKYKKENSSFLGADVFNAPPLADSFDCETIYADMETDFGYRVMFRNYSDMKVKSVECIYQEDGIAKVFRTANDDFFIDDEEDKDWHTIYGQISAFYKEDCDYTKVTVEYYCKGKGYITYSRKDYGFDGNKKTEYSWTNYYKNDYGYCMIMTKNPNVNKENVIAEKYKCIYSVEEY